MEAITAKELGEKLCGLENADTCKVYLCLRGIDVKDLPAVDAIKDTDESDSCVLILTNPDVMPMRHDPVTEPTGGWSNSI